MKSLANTDPTLLFENHSIVEIKHIQKQIKDNVDQKKEDLRNMVGERYRDLIEAADTIWDIKTSVLNITNGIKKLNELTLDAESEVKEPENIIKSDQVRDRYSIAARLKLLMDLPETIWSFVESKTYLNATTSYLFAKYIYSGLVYNTEDTSISPAQIKSTFPVVGRQWAAINHFRSVILSEAQASIVKPSVEPELVCQALLSKLLLGNLTVEKCLIEYLKARQSALHAILHPTKDNRSIREQICDVLTCVVKTAQAAYEIFSPESSILKGSSDTYLLVDKLDQLCSTDGECLLEHLRLQMPFELQYIPKHVFQFSPKVNGAVENISSELLQTTFNTWLDEAIVEVQTVLNKNLVHVTSVEGLSSIRERIYDLMLQDPSFERWPQMVPTLCGRSLSLWNDILRSVFTTRIKDLMASRIQQILKEVNQEIESLVHEQIASSSEEVDVTSFLWSEHVSDIPVGKGWITAQSLLTSGLVMKCQCYIPQIQSIWSQFDKSFKDWLLDLETYITKNSNVTQNNLRVKPVSNFQPFEKDFDNPELLSMLKVLSNDCVQRLLEALQVTNYLDSSKDTPYEKARNAAIILSCLSKAIVDLAPHLKLGIRGAVPERVDDTNKSRKSAMDSDLVHPEWKTVENKFTNASISNGRVWIKYLEEDLRNYISNTPLKGEHRIEDLKILPQWEAYDVEEESEDGKKVSSKIKVPVHLSIWLAGYVHVLVKWLNMIGAHTLPRFLTVELMSSAGNLMYEHMEEINKAPNISQSLALQLMFDVRYFAMFCHCSELKDLDARSKELWNLFSKHVDPFDLNVFKPYLTDNLKKAIQRTQTVFGNISVSEYLTTSTGTSSLAKGQEQHNVLPVSSQIPRFSLLPVSSKREKKISMSNEVSSSYIYPSSKTNSPEKSFNEDQKANKPLSSAASFFGAVSASWFGTA